MNAPIMVQWISERLNLGEPCIITLLSRIVHRRGLTTEQLQHRDRVLRCVVEYAKRYPDAPTFRTAMGAHILQDASEAHFNEFTNNHSDRVERQIMQAKCEYSQVPKARGIYGPAPADDPQEVIEQAEARIAAAKAQIAERARIEAIVIRTKHEIALAQATIEMLQAIKSRAADGKPVYFSAALATFRKELSPLAATYGYRIKLVGDKSEAALTEV